jgi:hypothetical protein
MNRVTHIKLILIFLLLLTSFLSGVTTAYGANVFVTTMDVTSRINLEAEVVTRGQFQISYDGGYKYQGKLAFQYYNLDLENDTDPALKFDGAQASVNDVFHFLDITYYTGFYGILGEGKHYKGHLYHRDPGFDYDGYLPILGTGLIFGMNHYDMYSGQLFVYQRYGSDYINSLDIGFGLDKDPFIFSLFLGISDQIYRAGSQIKYLGDEVEFYLTVGNPTIEPGNRIEFDDFYFLMEEWFKLKNWNLILSVFTRPKNHYNYGSRDYVDTDERNDIDFNFNLNYAPAAKYFSTGGELNIQTNKLETLGVFFSPYISINSAGIIWKVKVDFNVLSESRDLVTAYLNIRASF